MSDDPAATGPIALAPARTPNIRVWRFAVFTLFLANGFAMASWASRIPAVSNGLDLSLGQTGLLLTAIPVGAVVGLLISSHMLEHFGERRTALVSQTFVTVGLASVGLSVALSHNAVLSAAALAVYGVGMSMTNIVINLEAASVDRASGRTLMPVFHATWSIGAVLGAGSGALVSSVSLPIGVHFPAVAAIVLTASVLVVRLLPELRPTHAASSTPGFRDRMLVWLEPRTLLIGVIVLATTFNEGTANSWLSVAMVHGRGWDAAVGAAALTVFTASMMTGRFTGGLVVDRFGRALALRVAFVLAACGVLVVVFATSPALTFVGVALWGLGASLGYPLGMSAAADDPHNAAARVSAVATVSTIAGLVGPSIIGGLGELLGLPQAFIVVAGMLVLAVLVAGAVRPVTAER